MVVSDSTSSGMSVCLPIVVSAVYTPCPVLPCPARWYLGIQSKKDPGHVMTEVYKALTSLDCMWTATNNYRVICARAPRPLLRQTAAGVPLVMCRHCPPPAVTYRMAVSVRACRHITPPYPFIVLPPLHPVCPLLSVPPCDPMSHS